MLLGLTTCAVLSLLVLSDLVTCNRTGLVRNCEGEGFCRYGVCSTESKCRCNLDCTRASPEVFVCSRGNSDPKPLSLCLALSNACTENITKGFRTFPFTQDISCDEFLKGKDPNKDKFFCEDQRICKDNGICVKDTYASEGYCRCFDGYTGLNCVERSGPSLQPSVSIHSPVSATALSIRKSPNGRQSNLLSPIPVFAIMTCMSCGCLIFFTVQSRNRKKREKDSECCGNDDTSQGHEELLQSAVTETNDEKILFPQSHCIFMTSLSRQQNDESHQGHFNNKDDFITSTKSNPLTTIKLL